MRHVLATIIIAVTVIMTQAQGVKVGDKAPAFTLKNIDGKMVSSADFSSKKGVIVIFTCNHCPYAKAYESRIVAFQTTYGEEFPVVAINPNDAKEYPDDSFENMIVRAKESGFNFPYLYDATQEVAKAYGVAKTPQVYLLQKTADGFKVVYIGAIDDNYVNAKKAKKKYVEAAIASIKKGEKITPNTTAAVGCSIKWKK